MQAQSVVRPKDLKKVVGLSATTVWRLEKAGKFPKRMKLSAGAVGWLQSELEEWIATRKTAPEADERS